VAVPDKPLQEICLVVGGSGGGNEQSIKIKLAGDVTPS
jgi:hypothetical protein